MITNVDLNRLAILLRKVELGEKVSKFNIRWAINLVEQLKINTTNKRREKNLQNEKISTS